MQQSLGANWVTSIYLYSWRVNLQNQIKTLYFKTFEVHYWHQSTKHFLSLRNLKNPQIQNIRNKLKYTVTSYHTILKLLLIVKMNHNDDNIIFKDSDKDTQLYLCLKSVCVKQHFESQCFLITTPYKNWLWQCNGVTSA